MSNTFDDFKEALNRARAINYAADQNALDVAKLLLGRLRTVKDWRNDTLVSLKKELRDFNAGTRRWKD